MGIKNKNNNSTLWIAWENHRRSIELCKHFGISSVLLQTNLPRPIKYPVLIIKTIIEVLTHRPSIIFIQCPSVFLVLTGWVMKKLLHIIVITDAHNACLYPDRDIFNILNYLSKLVIKLSDFIIVTNTNFAKLVNIPIEKTIILNDKFFIKATSNIKNLKGELNFCYISSNSYDEPIDKALRAFTLLPKNHYVYITGKHERETINKFAAFKNIVFTGYMQTSDYYSLIKSCDITITLTTRCNCLQCGATEAVSFETPLICSNNYIEKKYFGDEGISYTQMKSNEIYNSIKFAVENIDILKKELYILCNSSPSTSVFGPLWVAT